MAAKGREKLNEMDSKRHESSIPLAEKLTKNGDASSAFTHEQKISMIQSILQTIPHEKEKPRNPVRPSTVKRENSSISDVSGRSKSADPDTIENDLFNTTQDKPKNSVPNPLPDPYAKSMKYYEKHLILNNFQHMTAKLVLHRPTSALDFMIQWCKEMQGTHEPLSELTAEQLYEPEVEDKTTAKVKEKNLQPDKSYSFQTFGNERTMKTTTPVASPPIPARQEETVDHELPSLGLINPPLPLQVDDEDDGDSEEIESEGSLTPRSGNTVSPTSLSEASIASDVSVNT